MTWTVVPNFRALGPRLGAKLPQVKQALAEAEGAVLRRQLEAQGWVDVAGERLTADEVEVRAGHHEEFALAQEGPDAVALDLELDDELRAEGFARTLVRELNDLRKQLGLAISDRVRVRLDGGGRLQSALASHRDWIMTEVLAVDLEIGGAPEQTISVDGETVRVSLLRAA
jgi:isoleucyl-tRNA synthetase